MTEAELLAAAARHAKAARFSADQFLGKVYTTPNYAYKDTEWYRAMSALQQLKTLAAPPPLPPSPPLPVPTGLAQNVMFTAWNPHAGLRAPVKYKLAITADVHVGGDAQTPAQFTAAAKGAAQQQHDRHGLVACWGNQDQVGTQQIQTFGAIIGADYLIFQAETEGECATALAAVKAGITKVVIGNPNAWTEEQRNEAATLINAGRFVLIFEVYTNEGGPWPDAASSMGVPAAAESPGVGWGATPYQLPAYKEHTAAGVWAGISPYIADTFDETSWSVLP